jgi:hypothetical protein
MILTRTRNVSNEVTGTDWLNSKDTYTLIYTQIFALWYVSCISVSCISHVWHYMCNVTGYFS